MSRKLVSLAAACLMYLLPAAQTLQINVVPGYGFSAPGVKFSGPKIGYGFEWIPYQAKKIVVGFQYDFFLPRQQTVREELFAFTTLQESGEFITAEFTSRRAGLNLGISWYANGEPFARGLVLGAHIRGDLFSATGIKASAFNDSLYYFNLGQHVVTSSVNGVSKIEEVGPTPGETDWASFGLTFSAGYYMYKGHFFFKPTLHLGGYMVQLHSDLQVKRPWLYLGADLTVGYYIEDILWFLRDPMDPGMKY